MNTNTNTDIDLQKKRINSLISIKKELKKMKLDNPKCFQAIEELNSVFKKYIYGEPIDTVIFFPEFNRNIIVKLDPEFPSSNTVVLSKKEEI